VDGRLQTAKIDFYRAYSARAYVIIFGAFSHLRCKSRTPELLGTYEKGGSPVSMGIGGYYLNDFLENKNHTVFSRNLFYE